MNPFDDSEKPVKMLHCSRAFGLLTAIDLEEDCIIATIEGHKVVLPEEMQARLEPFMNKDVALARFDDEFYLRDLETF